MLADEGARSSFESSWLPSSIPVIAGAEAAMADDELDG